MTKWWKHWVFDLDGTLILPVHDFDVIRAALQVPEGVDVLHHLAALPPEKALPMRERLHDIERDLVTRTGPAHGAGLLLEFLVGQGCSLGILTRNTREVAVLTLEQVGLAAYFATEAILGRADALPKPDPDGIHKLATYWGAGPAEIVMVGDYLYDLQAGQAAGAATIHVHGDQESRWPEWTDHCVHSLSELACRLEHEVGRCANHIP